MTFALLDSDLSNLKFDIHSVCRTFGLLDIRFVRHLVVGHSVRWKIVSLDIRFVGHSVCVGHLVRWKFGSFGHSGGWTFGSLDYGLVRPLAGCDATPIITGVLPSFIGDRDLDQGLSCLLGTQAFLQEKK